MLYADYLNDLAYKITEAESILKQEKERSRWDIKDLVLKNMELQTAQARVLLLGLDDITHRIHS